MPRAPKECGQQGCTTIVPNGRRCPDHANGWKNSPRTASTQRTSQTGWKMQRARTLQRDNHTCQIRGPRCTIEATQVDHIRSAAAGGTNQLTNLQAVCKPCHDLKTAREAREVLQ
jgi:5-methylcytosine-specific restriction protein A